MLRRLRARITLLAALLTGAVLTGALLRGNALSAATDAAAGFVADSIAATDPEAPTALGVWFEPLLGRLAPREV